MKIWKIAGKTPYLASAFCFYMLAEGMWEPGSWEWGAAAVAFLIVGLVWNNWHRLAIAIPKIRFVASESASQEPVSGTWFDSFLTVSAWLGAFLLLVLFHAYLEERIYGRQWDHPYLSADETQKAEDACVMKAYEAIGGGQYQRQHDRQDYIDSCMESQGFIQQKVEP